MEAKDPEVKGDTEVATPKASPAPNAVDEYHNASPKYLVTGGSGFLGRHIVDALLARGDTVRVLDLEQSFEDEEVEFVIGDLCRIEDVIIACNGVEVVFHVASLTKTWGEKSEFYDVNVKGTKNVLDACIHCGVQKLIYTSTGSVILDGRDVKMGDESLDYPTSYLDSYSATKAEAEQMIVAANGTLNAYQEPLLTCSLRPHCMFGPRDANFISQLIAKAREGDITHMIGDGMNVVDFTYVENAVYAHLLAEEKLKPKSKVPGSCYFITNGEPRRFWDFINTILTNTGCVGPTKSISFGVAYAFAYVMEFLHWIVGRFIDFRPTITRHMVCTMACHHWFSLKKANRELGYKPVTSLDQGLRQTIEYFQQTVRKV